MPNTGCPHPPALLPRRVARQRTRQPGQVSRRKRGGPTGATSELCLSNASQHSRGPSAARREPEMTEPPESGGFRVGDTGIEPVTPTVSRCPAYRWAPLAGAGLPGITGLCVVGCVGPRGPPLAELLPQCCPDKITTHRRADQVHEHLTGP
jgi:hypothetical protein